MDDGRRQLDMPHSFPAHLGLNDFNAAFLTDHAAMTHAFILTAITLVILGRPENFGAE